jgi:tryptophanyl-tRNA synthetase
MSAVTQSGDMLFPQVLDKMPGIIPVGIDQDPHIRLCRDIVARTKSRFGFIPVSSVYNKFTPGLDGSMKMSKSKPSSVISLPEDVSSVSRKIRVATTGGRETVEEQKKLGGCPDKCPIYDLYKLHLIRDDARLARIYNDCRSGNLLCKEDKSDCSSMMVSFMDNFNEKLRYYKKKVGSLNFIA